MKRSSPARRIALLGMLFALAMVLSLVESSVCAAFGLPPGVRLGLANIVVMYALLCLGKGDALALVVLKSLFGMLTRGATAGLLSLCGGLLSLGVMLTLSLFGKTRKEYFILSVSGALAHNMGQLAALNLFVQSSYTFYYLPVLLVSGVVMGALIALSLRAVLPALEKLGLKK